jgi:hypothetical protein
LKELSIHVLLLCLYQLEMSLLKRIMFITWMSFVIF